MVQITSVPFINIIKCHNRSATVSRLLRRFRTRVSRAANVSRWCYTEIRYRMHLDLYVYIFCLYADTGCQETSPHSSRSTVILSQKLLLFSFVLAHSSRRPPFVSPRSDHEWPILDFSQELFFTRRILPQQPSDVLQSIEFYFLRSGRDFRDAVV